VIDTTTLEVAPADSVSVFCILFIFALLHAKLVNIALNSLHDLNVVGPVLNVKYHGVHGISILAYVLSLYEPLYVVPFHHFNLVDQ
jgi:hypothetical protein